MKQNNPSSVIDEQIKILVSIISVYPEVKTIMLFGSSATGSRSENSDLDVFVITILDRSETNNLTERILRDIFGRLSLPLDLIVETENDFMYRSLLPTLERKIAREGKVIYAA